MSYALGQVSSEVKVGSRAARDPILARASLAAAKILRAAASRSKAARPAYIRHEVRRRFGAKPQAQYTARLGAAKTDQAVYDALRIAIADRYVRVGLRYLQRAMKRKYGEKFVPAPLQGLGALGETDEGKAIGCTIGGAATGILAAVIGGYTGGAGAAPVGAAGTMAMSAAGCGAETAAAQGELAAAQAQAAQAQLQAAQVAAQAQAAASAARTKQIVTIGAVTGGVLLLAGVGYMIVK